MDNKRKFFFIFQLILFLLGFVILFAGSLIFLFAIKPALNSFLQKNVVANSIISSPEDDGWSQWTTTWNFTDAPPYYSNAYFYNLTNSAELLSGEEETPNFEQIGPFVYLQNRTRLDITFLDNATKVNFNELRQYLFVPQLSVKGLDPDTAIIVNLNPGYVGAISQVNDPNSMMAALTGPVLQKKGFDLYFSAQPVLSPKNLKKSNGPSSPANVKSPLYSKFAGHMLRRWQGQILQKGRERVAPSMPFDQFISLWAFLGPPPNATQEWRGLSPVATVGRGLRIGATSAAKLWDATLSLSLLHESNETEDFYEKLVNGSSISADQLAKWAQQLQLNSSEVPTLYEDLQSWLSSWEFADGAALSAFQQLWGEDEVKTLDDVGWLQWANGAPLRQLFSVVDLYQDARDLFVEAPEYYSFVVTTGYCLGAPPGLCYDYLLNVSAAKFLLVGALGWDGVFNMSQMGLLLEVAQNGDAAEYWGLSINQTVTFFGYVNIPGIDWAKEIFHSEIEPAGGGLIARRTVNEWLYTAVDPFLVYADPEKQLVAFLDNDTSAEDARAKKQPSTFYTGKDNWTQVAEFIDYQGQTHLDFYGFPMPVKGVNDWGQFEPFLNPEEPKTIATFSDDFFRTVDLVFDAEPTSVINNRRSPNENKNSDEEKYFGVELLRFHISPSFWQASTLFTEAVSGFVNESGPQMGAPVHLCQPHFFGADDKWRQLVSGVPAPNSDTDETVVDIEPLTGKVLHAYQGLQINFLLNSSHWFAPPEFPALPIGRFYPVVWIVEEITLNKANAAQIKLLYDLQFIEQYGVWLFVILGGVLLALQNALLLCYVARRGSTRDHYEEIN